MTPYLNAGSAGCGGEAFRYTLCSRPFGRYTLSRILANPRCRDRIRQRMAPVRRIDSRRSSSMSFSPEQGPPAPSRCCRIYSEWPWRRRLCGSTGRTSSSTLSASGHGRQEYTRRKIPDSRNRKLFPVRISRKDSMPEIYSGKEGPNGSARSMSSRLRCLEATIETNGRM